MSVLPLDDLNSDDTQMDPLHETKQQSLNIGLIQQQEYKYNTPTHIERFNVAHIVRTSSDSRRKERIVRTGHFNLNLDLVCRSIYIQV